MSEGPREQTSKLRLWATTALVACYILPLVIITLYNTSLLPLGQGWVVLSLGLVAAMVGSAVLFVLLRRWEEEIAGQLYFERSAALPSDSWMSPETQTADSYANAEALEELQRLRDGHSEGQRQRDTLCEELHGLQRVMEALKREKEQLELLCQQQQDSLASQELAFQEEMKGKETRLEEYQHTITDQRTVIEKKQQQILALEGEIRDLRYELKTLVDLSDSSSEDLDEPATAPPPVAAVPTVRTIETVSKTVKLRPDKGDAPATLDLGLGVASRSLEEAQQQLKRCIDIAQKLTGARHLAGDSSRFRDLSADGYALDFRRLCDSLGSEQSCVIMLYSQRENKVLFVNNQVRGMLGWSPDKFLQNFSNLFVDGMKEWRTALQKAATAGKCDATLFMKSRSGEENKVCCLLGAIPTGIFKTHIVGILYSAE